MLLVDSGRTCTALWLKFKISPGVAETFAMALTSEQLLERIEQLRKIFDEAFPGNALEVPNEPAPLRAVENLWMVRRTLGSVALLMRDTIRGDGEDRTEDAAVLVRRLMELFADTFWMTDYEIDPDAQALRAILSELRETRKKCNRIVDLERSEDSVAQAKMKLDEIDGQEGEISRALGEARAPKTGRQNTTDILTNASPSLAFYYSFESDVAHGGVVGRQLQRDEEHDVGANASPERRRQVLAIALATTADTVIRGTRLLERSKGEFEDPRARIGQLVSGHEADDLRDQ